MQHVFIVGAKGFTYGGYETFLDKLTEYHKNNEIIKYHIACKANGPGMTDETKLAGAKKYLIQNMFTIMHIVLKSNLRNSALHKQSFMILKHFSIAASI